MEKESDFCRAVMKTPSMFLWSGEGHRGENLLVDDEGRWMHPYDAKITTFIVAWLGGVCVKGNSFAAELSCLWEEHWLLITGCN